MMKDEPSGQDNREGRTENKAFLSRNHCLMVLKHGR